MPTRWSPKVPQLTDSATQEAKKEWRPSRHIGRDLKLEQEGHWITTGQNGRLLAVGCMYGLTGSKDDHIASNDNALAIAKN